MEERSNIRWHWFCLCLVTLTTLWPIFSTLYTHEDDTYLAFSLSYSNAWAAFLWVRRVQSLFVWVWAPYLVDNFLYFKVVSLLPIVASLLLFGHLIKKVFHSNEAGLLATLCAVLSLQNTLVFNPLTANHFSYYLAISAILLSLLYLEKHYQAPSWQRNERPPILNMALSAFFFFISLTIYELDVVYFLPICLLTAFHVMRISTTRQALLSFWPHLLGMIIYLILYIGAKHVGAGNGPHMDYNGTSLSLDVARIARTVWQFSISSLPAYSFFSSPGLLLEASDLYGGHRPDVAYLVRHARPEWIVKFFLVVAISWSPLFAAARRISAKMSIALCATGAFLIILPTTLLAVTVKYQIVVIDYGFLSYVSIAYSSFGTALVMFSLASLVGRMAIGNHLLLQGAALSIGLCFGVLGFLNDYSNFYISRLQTNSRMIWDVMNAFARTRDFRSLPNNAVIYAPTLWNSLVSRDEYWTSYLRWKTRKKVTVFKDASKLPKDDRPVFFLKYMQERGNPNQYLVFAKIEKVEDFGKGFLQRNHVYSSRAAIYSMSPHKRFSIYAQNLEKAQQGGVFFVDGQAVGPVERHKILTVDKTADGSKLVRTGVSGGLIDLDSILLSYYLNVPE